MKVICYYSDNPGSPYFIDATRLRRSLDRHGVPHRIVPVTLPTPYDWHDATAHKAEFIRRCRREEQGGLLWVDADAVFHADPSEYFDTLDCDFAVHYFRNNRLLSGTMYFADTPAARALVEEWCKRNAEKRARGDRSGGGQRNLWEVIDKNIVPGLHIHRLPGRYCYVYRKPLAYPPAEPRIIEHTIASRENREESLGRRDPARRARLRMLDARGPMPARKRAHWLNWFAGVLAANRRFGLLNFGDGEWACVLGKPGKNAQGGAYDTPGLREALAAALMRGYDRRLLYGLNAGRFRDAAATWCTLNGVRVRWVDKEILSSANYRGELAPVIRALRSCRKRLMVIGPPHLRRLPEAGVIYYNAFVEVPERDAFREFDRILAEALGLARSERINVILVSAGMAAKPLVVRLWEHLPQATIMDMGAVWDPYLGRLTRRGYRRRDIIDKLAGNLVNDADENSLTAARLRLALLHVRERRRQLRDGPFDTRVDRAYATRFHLADALQPRSICEIGVRAGYYASIMLAASPQARYYGIDADNGTWGGKRGYTKHAQEFLARFEPTIEIADSQKLDALPGRFDLVHVDGDHSYQGCRHDINLAWAACNMAVAVDDYMNLAGVRRACDEFSSAHPDVDTEILDDGGYRGCWVAYKPLTAASATADDKHLLVEAAK